MRRLFFLLSFFVVAAPALAQSPRITPEGDPSIQNDTIYSLAVDPGDHPEESFIYLLDDGVLRLEADGRGSRTYRQVVQILDKDAVERWGERTFGYYSSRQRLTVNWARVIATDGTVISESPAHEQVLDVPVPEASPVFTDRKQHRISLSGVEPGTIIDYSYTVETFDPVMPGDFHSGWTITTGRTTRRSRLILDLPADLEPRISERNLGSMRRVEEVDGRKIYFWEAAEIPRTEGQLFASNENTIHQGLTITAGVSWEDVARWYHSLSADRYALTPEIRAALSEVLEGAATREDSLRAVHRWIAQDFRYVSLSLGIGGYQPRTPEAVFETKSGDCKDKATLFVAISREMGFDAYPVLIRLNGRGRRDLPTVAQFDHMIAAVATDTGYTYLDLTASHTPFGEVVPSLQGEFGLLVREDGGAEEVELPESAREENRSEARFIGVLDSTGVFNGRYEERVSGTMQYTLRGLFSATHSDKELEEFTRFLGGMIMRGARGDSLEVFDGNDLAAEPRISLKLIGGELTRSAGDNEIMTLPIPNFPMDPIIAELEAEGERRYPFDIGDVVGWQVSTWELQVTLPEGWKAQLPDNVDVKSAFGEYSTEYGQDGRELRIVRRMAGSKGVAPPSAKEELIEWMRAVSADVVPFIVIEKQAAVAAGS